ncbi:MAG: glycosyltransferase family 4 protein [Gammaproteobacteria bacterium]|nr:glycosyltransferase family 4 protein [Gammaproteobacteria bacterium]
MERKIIKIVLNEEYQGMTSGWPTRYIGIIRELVKYNSLYLFAPGNTDTLKKVFPNSWVCESTSNQSRFTKGGLLDFLASLVKPNPEKINRSDYAYFDEFKELLEHDDNSYDVSLYFAMSGYIIYGMKDQTKNIICDFCDSRNRATKSKLKHKYLTITKKISYLLDIAYINSLKRKLMSPKILGLAITREDVEEIERSFKGNMLVISNGIEQINDLTDEYLKASYQSKHYLFIGGLNFEPNIYAVKALTENIWPSVNQENKSLILNIVGRNPVESVRTSVENSPNTVLNSNVESTTPYYERAKFFVVPIYFGAGMKNKVLEALAAGTPVIMTTEAAKGIKFEHGKHGFIADSDDEFVKRIHEIEESMDLNSYIMMSEFCVELAKGYSWEQACRPLVRHISNIKSSSDGEKISKSL